MKYQLRPYQQLSVDKTIEHIKKCHDSCLLELATGAGKSLIVAELAQWIHATSKKRVLCLAPSRELVMQNREKYLSYGYPASLFSASAGRKDLRHEVVFGSPQSVNNSLDKFGDFAAVIIDEAHGITKTIKTVIDHLKSINPLLRVIGLTATPYRMGSGYIYEVGEDNQSIPEDQTKSPYFKKLICSIKAEYLIEQGFLTPPVADIMDGYNTDSLEMKSGKFTSESIDRAFVGQGRVTSEIVAQVVGIAQDRKGVMFFASTIQHAQEIIESLPPELSRLVTGETPKAEREKTINDFKSQRFKYLVNVAVLTTGFDAPHVDLIAILRATESASLLQQIIGRGLRLYQDKPDCLVLDYAGNIERHKLEDNIFAPDIKVSGGGESSGSIEAECETCGTVNLFSARPNKESLEFDKYGYFIDLAGDRVDPPLPAHFGRRCTANVIRGGIIDRCDGRWTLKECPECDAENDIAARYCVSCKAELVDPNEKLEIDFARMKKDPYALSTDKVLSWYAQPWVSQSGNRSLRVDWTTEYRTFSAWYSPDSKAMQGQALWADLSQSVFGQGKVAPSIDLFISALKKGQGKIPVTITAKKDGSFFKVIGHNRPEDVLNV